MSKLLRDIEFGEPDANAEYYASLRSKRKPLFIRAWNAPEIARYDAFTKGEKFIITGQKGTGKTAILRYMEAQAIDSGYKTEFIVFKNEIMNEAELISSESMSLSESIVDEEKIKQSKFYYHSIKRIMISLLISKIKKEAVPEEIVERGIVEKLFGKSGSDAVRLGFDAIGNIISASQINVDKLSLGRVNIDQGRILKKANDDLLNYVISRCKEQSIKIRIFFDEMHFAFRDKETLRSDAVLVRDTVLAAQSLNERFIREGIDAVIYLALRREFLEQPEIAQADIVHVIESYGETVSWEHHPFARNHPIFDFITLRFKASIGPNFSKNKLFSTYLSEIDPLHLLEYTWAKPRDIVRFFKAAQANNGNTIIINENMYRSVLRSYSISAWAEIKSALGAFVPINALPLLEESIKEVVPGQYDGSLKLRENDFINLIRPAYSMCQKEGAQYRIEMFARILYIMGVYFYRYTDSSGRDIYQQYHRGNLHPQTTGEIRIHPAVARALS